MKYIFSLSFICFLLLLLPLGVNAQDNLSIGYSPSNIKLKLEAGEFYEDEIVFWNLSDSSISYNIYISGFKQIENTPGTSIPLSPEEDRSDPYSASDWFIIKKDQIELPPNKNIKLPYMIDVPTDVALGEYHVKVFLTSELIDTDTEDSFNEAIAKTNLASGPPILIQIGDDTEITQELSLVKFSTDKHFYDKIDVNFITELNNSGNTHVTPTGSIFIENIFGDVVSEIPFSEGELSLMRGTSGEYNNKFTSDSLIRSEDGVFAIGPLKAKLVLTYKTINPGFSPLQAETSFWIIPWKLLLILLGAIVGVIMFFVVISKRRKGKGKKK